MALPPLTLPIRDIGWQDWPSDDLVVLVCPSGAHEGKSSQGLGTIRQLGYDENYVTNSYRAGARWCVVVPTITVPHFTIKQYSVAPPELQGTRPPD